VRYSEGFGCPWRAKTDYWGGDIFGIMFVNITQHFSTAARQKAARMLGSFRVMVMLVAGLWFVEMADQMWRRSSPGHSLDVLGVYPRTVSGLAGILGAPFVHDGFGHLANNTLPLVVLGWLVMLGGRRLFFKVSGMIVVVAGVVTWVAAPAPGPHLGASSLIYGYLGFLLVRGFLEPSVRWVLVSVTVGVLYTSVLGGLLPVGTVSGAGHLGGFVGGVLAGWLLFYMPKWRSLRLQAGPRSGG
jgi:membrane associated rhomboid family serine protease